MEVISGFVIGLRSEPHCLQTLSIATSMPGLTDQFKMDMDQPWPGKAANNHRQEFAAREKVGQEQRLHQIFHILGHQHSSARVAEEQFSDKVSCSHFGQI